MPGGGELQGPVGYDDRWVLLAALTVLAVAAYYGWVLWWFRDGSAPHVAARRRPRESCLALIDGIESDVGAGLVAPRAGHQQLSAAVRGFVAEMSGIPADRMTLADFRREGHEPIADLVALIYPPSFVEDDRVARARFVEVTREARQLVRDWP
jgi:hypothetical protein